MICVAKAADKYNSPQKRGCLYQRFCFPVASYNSHRLGCPSSVTTLRVEPLSDQRRGGPIETFRSSEPAPR